MARIVLITDHKWRDLPGNVYLKLLLEKLYSHKVMLVRLNEESAVIPSFKPDMVVYNNLYDEKKNQYARYISSRGVKVIILPTEGITFSDQQTDLFTHKYADIQFVDMYLSWNSLMGDAIKNNNVLDAEKVVTVGNGRFDFYSEDFKRTLMTRHEFSEKYGVDEYKINVLLATNFANAEFWPNTKFLSEDLKRQRATGLDYFRDAGKLAYYEWEYRQAVFKMIRELCENVRDVNFLIKYHPSERTSVYQDLIREIRKTNNNAYLIEGEYIWDVINISDIVLQRCSTVAIEAWLKNKVTVELKLKPSLEHFLQPKYEHGSISVGTSQELCSVINQYMMDKENILSESLIRERKSIMASLIHQADGKASERIAKEIDKCLYSRKNKQLVTYQGFKNIIKGNVRRWFGMRGYDFISGLYRMKFGDYLGRYDKTFSEKDVEFWTLRLKKILNKPK